MVTKAWIIFTPEQRAAAIVKNETTDFKVIPRVIDHPQVGNLGDPVVALGASVAGASILNDFEYAPVWADTLNGLPIRTLDSDVLFKPSDV